VSDISHLVLYLSIIERAICDATGNTFPTTGVNGKMIEEEAKQWLYSNSDEEFGFLDLCSILRCSPDRIRDYVLHCNKKGKHASGILGPKTEHIKKYVYKNEIYAIYINGFYQDNDYIDL
jgi:hypothetical protein